MNCREADFLLFLLVHEHMAKSADVLLGHLKGCSECRGLFVGSLVLRAVERIARDEWEETDRGMKRVNTDDAETRVPLGL